MTLLNQFKIQSRNKKNKLTSLKRMMRKSLKNIISTLIPKMKNLRFRSVRKINC